MQGSTVGLVVAVGRARDTPWGLVEPRPAPEGTAGRILDAAFDLFAANGVRKTTMGDLAEASGISRVWLYRYFDNRDAIVAALLGREAYKFLEDLTPLIDPKRPLPDTVTDLVVFAITELRTHPLLVPIITSEPEVIGDLVVSGIGSLMTTVIEGSTTLLEISGQVNEPAVVAETLVRLVVFAVLNNATTTDYDDPAALKKYASTVVRALLAPQSA